MYAVIRNATRYTGTQTFAGHVESRHDSLEDALRAEARSQRACTRANGPHTWLDLRVIEIEWDGGEAARGESRSSVDLLD